MIELLLKLVGELRDLGERREKQRNDLFKNFVEPAWKDFEAVHQNYLESLRRYSELVAREDWEFDHRHPLFAAIELDSMLSDSLRARIYAAWATTDARLNDQTEVPLRDLLRACLNYLSLGMEPKRAVVGTAHLNNPRMVLTQSLRSVASRSEDAPEEVRRAASLRVKVTIEELQTRYSIALAEFNSVRVELLRPT